MTTDKIIILPAEWETPDPPDMRLTVPLVFNEGIFPVPLSEIRFVHDKWGVQEAELHEWFIWKDKSLTAFGPDGRRQLVSLAAKYSGYLVQSGYGNHPIEHISNPNHLWNVPILNASGKVCELTNFQKSNLGIPIGKTPPYQTELFVMAVDAETLVPVDSIPVSGSYFYKNPLYETIDFYYRDGAEKESEMFVDIFNELSAPSEPVFQIEDVLEQRTTNAVVGPTGSYKSFHVVSMGLSCATGYPWAGHKIVRIGPVIYFCGEGRHGIPRRVKAWLNDKEMEMPKGRFFMPRTRVEFDAVGARKITAAVSEIANEYGNPVLMIIDTLARSMPASSDENSAKDMMAFINICDELRDRFECSVIVVTHTGHAEDTRLRARGSSAFRAAMDSEIVVDDRRKLLTWTKMKDAEGPEPISYSLRPVDPSAVIDYGKATEDKISSGRKLNKVETLGLTSLTKACSENQQHFTDISAWRYEFYRSHWGESPEAKRKAFSRAREGLVAAGMVHVEDDNYFIRKPDNGQTSDMSGQMSGARPDGNGQGSLEPVRLSGPLSEPDIHIYSEADFIGEAV